MVPSLKETLVMTHNSQEQTVLKGSSYFYFEAQSLNNYNKTLKRIRQMWPTWITKTIWDLKNTNYAIETENYVGIIRNISRAATRHSPYVQKQLRKQLRLATAF